MSANNLWFNRSKWNCNNEDRTHTLFFYILLAVFTSETLIMVLLDYVLPPMPVPATIILDGALLVSILFPTLYMLILKPLLHQIAERKRFEGELEEAFVELNDRKVFIESILANMQSGIIVTDLLMGVALVNSYAARFFGKQPDELDYISAAAAMGLGRSDLDALKIEEFNL